MPRERFSVKVTGGQVVPDTHLEFSDIPYGKLPNSLAGYKSVEKPGRIWFQLEGEEIEAQDNEINDSVQILTNNIPEKRPVLKSQARRLRHKLYGIKYHLQNFIDNGEAIISEFKSEYKSHSGFDMVIKKNNLIYELESFLFQIKSALDIIAGIISMTYNFPKNERATTYSKGGDKLVKSLQNNSRIKLKDSATELSKIVLKYKKWTSDVIDMRDDVTHFSDLEGFSCFTQYDWRGSENAEIAYPSMPDGERARTYMEKTWYQVLQIVKEIMSNIVSVLKIE
jgi:hypothetical protein